MKHFSAIFCTLLIFLSLGIARDVELPKNEQTSIIYNSQEFNLNNTPAHQDPNRSREQINLFLEDFEGEHGWSGDGWTTTEANYNSETHSQHSANDETTLNGNWNLLSPVISLPDVGEGETMHFDFFLDIDMPDINQDDDPSTPDVNESDYLADYYSISLLDLGALAWDVSTTDAYNGGSSFWAADQELGGYLDSWIQYLDTPSISIGSNGQLDTKIFYAIESDAGATVANSCTDGWDAANIRISSDGGATWMLLEDSNNPYHFTCGYGWIWNDAEYDTGGSLNHLAAGWGNQSDGWLDFSADLSDYANQDIIIRFAFGSDPAYSTPDDNSITGFKVDEISVSDDSGVVFSDLGDDMDSMVSSGEVWTDQFYDYFDDTEGFERPGSLGWEQYLPGLAFNGNTFLDITEFAGKDVIFRIQSRYDDDNTLTGDGLFIDDFRVYKESGGSYPSPTGLTAESGDSEIMLSWNDMNGSGDNVDFIWDNEPDTWGGIQMSETGSAAWAGQRVDLVGASNLNNVSVHLGPNEAGVNTTIAVFGLLGSLYNNEPMWTQEVTLQEGWNTFDVGLEMNNGYIVAMQFTNVENEDMVDGVFAPLDESSTPSENSMVLFTGGSWDLWSVAGATVADGEWGVRANISYEGANVTYNVYRDGDPAAVATGLADAMHTDTGLENNVEYYYQVSATYADGTESDYSDVVFVTPFSNTVYEAAYDDGTAEIFWNAGSGNTTVVKYSACSDGEQLVRFKWYQEEDAGAFYIKIHDDNAGAPGDELFSQVVAGGLVAGWNEYDLVEDALIFSGDFWIGIREFSSTRGIGVDTDSNAGSSQENSSGDFTPVAGNVMIRALLDEVNCGSVQCGTGDVNQDGNVDVLDVVQVVNFIIGNNTPDDVQACASDMNDDGNVDVLDVVQMVNMIIN